MGFSLHVIVFRPRFWCWPRVQIIFICVTTPRVFVNFADIDVFSHEVLGNNITMWVHYTNIFWPVVFVLDLHSTSFPFPETALIYVSVRSHSTMLLQVLLLGNSPGNSSSSSIIRPKIQFIPVPRLYFCAPRTGITTFSFSSVAVVRSNKLLCRRLLDSSMTDPWFHSFFQWDH